MHRSPRIEDPGGNSYGRTAYSTRRAGGGALSFTCRECKTLRYVTPRELKRAARPRCLRCGGTLIETLATAEKTLGREAGKVAKEDKELEPGYGPVVCASCKTQFRKHYALALHFLEADSCRKDVPIIDAGTVKIVQGSFFLARVWEPRRFQIKGVTPSGVEVIVRQEKNLYIAEKAIEPFVVSVTASCARRCWGKRPAGDVDDRRRKCLGCGVAFCDTFLGRFIESSAGHLLRHLLARSDCLMDFPDEVRKLVREIALRPETPTDGAIRAILRATGE